MRISAPHRPRHVVIAVTASVAALAWTTAPAGAMGGWTAATEVRVLGRAASYAPDPAETAPATDRTHTPGGAAPARSTTPAKPSAKAPTATAAPPASPDPNRARNGTIIGVGRPPAQAATTPAAAASPTP